jgi:hypothetical protein
MWLKDVRPEVTLERTYAMKFMANHYLSWNISNKLILVCLNQFVEFQTIDVVSNELNKTLIALLNCPSGSCMLF